MQADRLAGLLEALGMAPAVVVGGSGGSRVSLLTAARHPEVAAKLAMWWISGGIFGLMTLGVVYCGESIRAAWQGGMESVVELPEWAEVLDRNPGNRERMLGLDPQEFIAILEKWMARVLSGRRGPRSRPRRRDVHRACGYRLSSFAAERVIRTTPAPLPKDSTRSSPDPNWSSRRGVIGNGSKDRTRPAAALVIFSSVGRCSHHSCSNLQISDKGS